MKYIVLLFCIATFAFIARAGVFYFGTPGEPQRQVVIEVRPGQSFNAVATELYKSNIITSFFEFKVLAKLTGYTTKVKTGEYAFNGAMTPMSVLRMLASGISISYPITFPEGLNSFEMADMVETSGLGTSQEFLNTIKDPELIRQLLGEELSSLEGYLFPETYKLTKFEGVRALVIAMVRNFLKVYEELAPLRPDSNFTRHQWVILASIIEKETGFEKEREVISSVFHNRLKKNMRLQTDPTVIYGKWVQTNRPVKNIRKVDLQTKNRYNTYAFRGLPYGPIANPGRNALKAAFQPADTEFLYFVSRNNGTSKFSETLKEHNQAVRKYQLDQSNRRGKSWRDLSQ
ncbi:MAG: endolytic transglycosylase MltG [Bdellovibrionales bacterium]